MAVVCYKDENGNIKDVEIGGGTVKSVNNVEPDENGNVELNASDVNAVATSGGIINNAEYNDVDRKFIIVDEPKWDDDEEERIVRTEWKAYVFAKDIINWLGMTFNKTKENYKNIKKLNTSLVAQGFGENSGSANIFNGKIAGGLLVENGEVSGYSTSRITSDFIPVEPNTLYTQIAPTSAKEGRYCEYDANKNLVYFDQSGLQDTFTTKPTTKYLRISFGSGYGTTFKNDIAIIKGNATEYVPYIMSNKQLTEQNKSLDDYGLDNKFNGHWVQGYIDTSGNVVSANNFVNSGIYNCNGGDSVKFICDDSTAYLYLVGFNSSNTRTDYYELKQGKLDVKLNSATTKFYVEVVKTTGVTPSTAPTVRLYVGNAIDQLNADFTMQQYAGNLNNLVGSGMYITAGENVPVASNWFLLFVCKINSTTTFQFAILLNTKALYKRSTSNGGSTWSAWA